jgi:hypothetical protein
MSDDRMNIAGYDYGRVARSPVTLDDLHRLEQTMGFGEADRRALLEAGEILGPQAEAMVDGWRTIIGAHEHLARWFFGPDGKPDDAYKASVKRRFVRWVVDLCSRPFDQAWLDYQHEIGLRHTPAKKNATDAAHTAAHVPLRYVLAFSVPVIQSAKERLAQAGISGDRLERMSAAWAKAVILTLTLWSEPYTREGLW